MAIKRKVATRYTTRACDFCKARHLRCDGQDSCFQCKKRNQACNYTQKNIKRGPKPKKKKRKDGDELDQSLSGDDVPMQTGIPGWRGIRYDDLYIPGMRPMDYPVPVPVGQKELEVLRPFPSFPYPRESIAVHEPSSDITYSALLAFAEKISPVYPNNFNLDPRMAYEAWKQVSSNYQYSKLNEIVDAFMYCVVLGHGTKLVGNEIMSMEFSSKGETLAHTLFYFPSTLSPEMFSPHADILVSCTVLLGVLKLEAGDFNGARLCFLQGYQILNMNANDVTPNVAHRLYAHLAGMSRSTPDMAHWVSNAHSLPQEAQTPINLVMLSLLYCSPNMLRDPKNKPLPLVLLMKQKDQQLFQKMIRELDETENLIWEQTENAKELSSNSEEYVMSYKIIIEGCRAIVLAQSGLVEQATICAEKCIRDSKSLQARVSYWAIPLTLAYSLQVVKTLNNQALFNEGIPILNMYADHYPIVHQMIQILSAKNVDTGPTALEIPIPLNMSMGLSMGMGGMLDLGLGIGMGGLGMVPGMVPGMMHPGVIPGMVPNLVSGIVPGMVNVGNGIGNGGSSTPTPPGNGASSTEQVGTNIVPSLPMLVTSVPVPPTHEPPIPLGVEKKPIIPLVSGNAMNSSSGTTVGSNGTNAGAKPIETSPGSSPTLPDLQSPTPLGQSQFHALIQQHTSFESKENTENNTGGDIPYFPTIENTRFFHSQ